MFRDITSVDKINKNKTDYESLKENNQIEKEMPFGSTKHKKRARQTRKPRIKEK